MREIKFRAWDRERKEMLRVTMMDWPEWWVSCDPTYGQAPSSDYGERNSFKNEDTDRHILMQYTGLKDKNDKEIYEGDILKTKHGVHAVVYDKYQFALDGFYCSSNDVPGDYFSEQGWDEVIGNIYESPNLLQQPTG